MADPVIDTLNTYADELIAIRRDIHAHPETAFEEVRTAALVARELRSYGIEVTEGLGKTGVVGTIRGNKASNRAVALRADMDALHIQETTGAEYASTVAGKMHACGHDGHTAMLLGAARYLAESRDFAGTVHLLFQPAEEGWAGARAMMEDGLFDRFPTDAVYGMHAMPFLPEGQFAIRPGPIMAASDSFTVYFRGTGAHGSAPQTGTDPSVPLAHFMLALQGIVGRNISGNDSAVISVGHVAGGLWGSPNIIPAEMVVRGTARSYTPEVRNTMERRLTEVAHGLAATYGCTAQVEYKRGYPATINHAATAASVVGDAMVDRDIAPLMGSEDFSYMLEAKPGAYMMLGTGGAHSVHTPMYDFNDRMLTTGAAYWVKLVQKELG
jgi:hippurate hydrolase